MKYEDIFEIVKTLEFDTEKLICTESGIKLYILRPSKVSKRFKNYDINGFVEFLYFSEGRRY